jgi:hypothetical protein
VFDNQHEVTVVLPLGCDVSADSDWSACHHSSGEHSSQDLSLWPCHYPFQLHPGFSLSGSVLQARQDTASAGVAALESWGIPWDTWVPCEVTGCPLQG